MKIRKKKKPRLAQKFLILSIIMFLASLAVAYHKVTTGDTNYIEIDTYKRHIELYKNRLKEKENEKNRKLEEKIRELENDVLRELADCESGGISEEDRDGIIIFDSNKKASIGRYQFQQSTIIHYYKTLYNKELSLSGALKVASDKQKATELARDILFKTKNGYKNWWICSKRLNLSTKIEIINKLRQ